MVEQARTTSARDRINDRRMRRAARPIAALSAVVLSGCLSQHHAESAALCGPTQVLPGWTGSSYLAASGDTSFRYQVGAQEPVGLGPQTEPGREAMYWVIFDGHGSTEDHSKPPKSVRNFNPMLFRADGASLDFNGKRVAPSSMAVSHVGENGAYSIPVPAKRIAVSAETFDLNQDPRPLLALGFPVKARASDRWVFHAGSMRIGSEDKPIPGQASCVKPAWDEPRNLWQM